MPSVPSRRSARRARVRAPRLVAAIATALADAVPPAFAQDETPRRRRAARNGHRHRLAHEPSHRERGDPADRRRSRPGAAADRYEGTLHRAGARDPAARLPETARPIRGGRRSHTAVAGPVPVNGKRWHPGEIVRPMPGSAAARRRSTWTPSRSARPSASKAARRRSTAPARSQASSRSCRRRARGAAPRRRARAGIAPLAAARGRFAGFRRAARRRPRQPPAPDVQDGRIPPSAPARTGTTPGRARSNVSATRRRRQQLPDQRTVRAGRKRGIARLRPLGPAQLDRTGVPGGPSPADTPSATRAARDHSSATNPTLRWLPSQYGLLPE